MNIIHPVIHNCLSKYVYMSRFKTGDVVYYPRPIKGAIHLQKQIIDAIHITSSGRDISISYSLYGVNTTVNESDLIAENDVEKVENHNIHKLGTVTNDFGNKGYNLWVLQYKLNHKAKLYWKESYGNRVSGGYPISVTITEHMGEFRMEYLLVNSLTYPTSTKKTEQYLFRYRKDCKNSKTKLNTQY